MSVVAVSLKKKKRRWMSMRRSSECGQDCRIVRFAELRRAATTAWREVGQVALRVIFFFQAEDGIRDKLVTGVQTCALPIFEGETGTGKEVVARAVHAL